MRSLYLDRLTRISFRAVKGLPYPRPKFLYSLPLANAVGSFFIMAPGNRSIVQRSWGLQELETRTLASGSSTDAVEQKRLTYGQQFKYDEFVVMPGRVAAATFSFIFAVSATALALIAPVCSLFYFPSLQYYSILTPAMMSHSSAGCLRKLCPSPAQGLRTSCVFVLLLIPHLLT